MVARLLNFGRTLFTGALNHKRPGSLFGQMDDIVQCYAFFTRQCRSVAFSGAPRFIRYHFPDVFSGVSDIANSITYHPGDGATDMDPRPGQRPEPEHGRSALKRKGCRIIRQRANCLTSGLSTDQQKRFRRCCCWIKPEWA